MFSKLTHEKKAHEAVEASRDPKSDVTAGDARGAIMDESRKAGAVALEFDANASPEEKAAQAKSVSHTSSTRQRHCTN